MCSKSQMCSHKSPGARVSLQIPDSCLCTAVHAPYASQDAFIPQDRESGRSRGFAFVTMADSAAAQAAISQLHDSDYNVSCTASMWDQCMLCAP
jgi:RNA recognition motif-containing protein